MSEALGSTGAIRAGRPAATDLLDDIDGTAERASGRDVGEWLWHLAISMRTGLVLIFGIAVCSFIGTMVAQAPAEVLADKTAYPSWVESLRPKYGGWTNIFDVLGWYGIFSSWYYRGLVVLLSTSILACSVNRAPKLWKQAVHPRTTMGASFFQHAALRANLPVAATVAQAGDALHSQLKRAGYRTIVTKSASGVDVYADKFRWGPFGTVAAHLSIILVVLGAMLGSMGFRDEGLVIPIGSTVPVGHGTNLTVLATSFNDAYYESGEPADYVSHVVLYDGGTKVGEHDIRVNQPMRYGDVSFYQSSFGPAAAIQVADATGKTVYDGGVPLQWPSQTGAEAIGQFFVPDTDLTVLVLTPASGRIDSVIKTGQLKFEVYKGPTQAFVGSQVVNPGQPVQLGSYSYTFLREQRYTLLTAARDPGAMLVWLGALLLVVGVGLVFFFPNRKIWARVRDDGAGGAVIEAGALTRHDVMFEGAFAKLVNDVQAGLGSPAAA